MNNQNFYLRLIALLMIIMAVFFYNGTVKDKEQEQSITDLTTQVQILQDQQEQEETAASQMLEYAFDFMEEVFGSGQEMVIFVTELNSDYYTVQFLQQYECERYYRYNRQLLVDESSQAIEEQLRQMGR